MSGGKHVKVKKQQRQDIVRYCADARKLILGSIGTHLDHLSINLFPLSDIIKIRLIFVHGYTLF